MKSGWMWICLLFALTGCSKESWSGNGLWGKAVGGLQIATYTDKPSFYTNEPLNLIVVFRNASSKPITFWQAGFWPNTLIRITDESMKPVPYTPEGTNCAQYFNPGGERPKNYKIVLEPKTTFSNGPFQLNKYFQLKNGNTYSIVVIYEEHLEGGWEGKIISNNLKILLK